MRGVYAISTYVAASQFDRFVRRRRRKVAEAPAIVAGRSIVGDLPGVGCLGFPDAKTGEDASRELSRIENRLERRFQAPDIERLEHAFNERPRVLPPPGHPRAATPTGIPKASTTGAIREDQVHDLVRRQRGIVDELLVRSTVLDDVGVQLRANADILEPVGRPVLHPGSKHGRRRHEGEDTHVDSALKRPEFRQEPLQLVAAESVDDDYRPTPDLQEASDHVGREREDADVLGLIGPVHVDEHRPERVHLDTGTPPEPGGEALRRLAFPGAWSPANHDDVRRRSAHREPSTAGTLQESCLHGKLQVFMIRDTSVARRLERMVIMSSLAMFPSGSRAKGIRR